MHQTRFLDGFSRPYCKYLHCVQCFGKTFQDHPNGVFQNPRIGTVAFGGHLFFDLIVGHRITFLGFVSHQKCGSNGFITVHNVVAAR